MIPWQLLLFAVLLAIVAGALLGEMYGYWNAVRDLTRRDDEVARARETLPRAWLKSYRWDRAKGWVRRDGEISKERADQVWSRVQEAWSRAGKATGGRRV